MDTSSTNNVNFNGNKQPSLHKSRSNFSQAAVAKSDVGDFQEGYFVMADMPSLPQPRNKTHKTPERNQRKNEHQNNNTHHRQQPRSTTDFDQHVQRESESSVSNVRITTSPTRSPPKDKRTLNSHSPQRHQTTTHTDLSTNLLPLSPHKPRKASQPHIHYEKRVDRSHSSPPLSLEGNPLPSRLEKGPSPPPANRWAGPAFSNAPPPSSLPIPDFPPFSPSIQQATESSSSPLSTSPSSPSLLPAFVSQQPLYHHQPLVYTPVAYHGYPLHLAYEIPSQPASLAQLSTDLRKMLNIGGLPITA